MADPRLDPPRSMPTYAVRAPLVRWLADEARRAHTELGARVLDRVHAHVALGVRREERLVRLRAAADVEHSVAPELCVRAARLVGEPAHERRP
ncbi:MAG: hypothetical protein R6W48_03550, partial [Gaiellaceae bacterium]